MIELQIKVRPFRDEKLYEQKRKVLKIIFKQDC